MTSISGPLRLLPRVRRVAPRRVPARRLCSPTGAGRSTTGWTGRGTRPPTSCSPPAPRSRRPTSNAASRPSPQVGRWLEVVEDPWLHARGEAIKGELARVQHRFGDAVVHLTSAVEASHRLGFLQTEAYQLSSLGRAQWQAGDYAAGVVTLRTSIDKAEATGDVRLAALIRVHLGRVLRAEGDLAGARAALESAAAWHREAGGGEQALLGECLLAALDAADGEPLAQDRLLALLDRRARAGRRPRGGLRAGRPGPDSGRLR